MATEDPQKSYAIALEEARRSFDRLADEVTVVRDRIVSTLGMGGLAAAFVGGLAIRDGAKVSGWTWTAVTAFALLATLTAVALWPRRFHVSQSPEVLVGWIEEHQASPADVERDLALWLASGFRADRADTRVEYEEWCPELG
ncbi:hypothetical protein [Rhodococcus rhodochrous]|uniref:hypothetical protein n=1 Tax=Rhodococcus rhodochrous TaxID=1829 RepID=UPI0011C43EC0